MYKQIFRLSQNEKKVHCGIGWARFHKSWKFKIPQPDYFHYRSSDYGKAFFSARSSPPGVPMASNVYVVSYSSKIVEIGGRFLLSIIPTNQNCSMPQILLVWTQKVTQQSLRPCSLIWQSQVTSDFM